jgi:hypothetical protein
MYQNNDDHNSEFLDHLVTMVLLVSLAAVAVVIINVTSKAALAQVPYADNHNNTPYEANMTLESVRMQYMLAWNHTRFKANFSTFIEPHSAAGFGVYREHGNNVFRPGEAIVLYVEPVGYGYKRIANDPGNNTLYLMNMTSGVIITDSNGTVLQTINNIPVASIISHRTNTELSLNLNLTQQQQRPFPVGDYVITYIITDQVSGQSFRLEKQIRISGAPVIA